MEEIFILNKDRVLLCALVNKFDYSPVKKQFVKDTHCRPRKSFNLSTFGGFGYIDFFFYGVL